MLDCYSKMTQDDCFRYFLTWILFVDAASQFVSGHESPIGAAEKCSVFCSVNRSFFLLISLSRQRKRCPTRRRLDLITVADLDDPTTILRT